MDSKGIFSAVTTGSALRFVGASLNIAAVPIAISGLGQDGYATLATLLGFASWLSLGALGMSNVVAMAIAPLNNDLAKEQRVVWQAFLTVIAATILILCLFSIPFAGFVDQIARVAEGEPRLNVGTSSLYCILAFTICAISAPFEGRLVGHLRVDYCNRVRLVCQLFALLVLSYSVLFHPTLLTLAIALTIGPVGAATWFIAKGQLELSYPKRLGFSLTETTARVKEGLGYVASSMAVLFLGGAGLPVFAFFFGSDELATASVMSRVVQIYFSLIAIFVIPLSAAIKNAISTENFDWVNSVIRYGCILVCLQMLLVVAFLLTLGEPLITLWTGEPLPGLDSWLWPLASLLATITWSYFWVYASFALLGARTAAGLAIFEIALICLAFSWVSDHFLPSSSMIVSASIIACVSGITLPTLVVRKLQKIPKT